MNTTCKRNAMKLAEEMGKFRQLKELRNEIDTKISEQIKVCESILSEIDDPESQKTISLEAYKNLKRLGI